MPIKQQIADKIKTNLNMINFYLKINKKANIKFGFLDIIKSSLKTNI